MNWLQRGTTKKESTLKEDLTHVDYEWRPALVKFVFVSHSWGCFTSSETIVNSTVKLRLAVHK